MPGTYTYPGVYVEELPSGVRTIAGVSTSDTAFVDVFPQGPLNVPVRVTSLDEFERRFGGLHRDSEASYAIAQYYLNGGSVAWVVRVPGDPAPATAGLQLQGGSPLQNAMRARARYPGAYGKNVQVGVDYAVSQDLAATHFNLVAREVQTLGGRRQVTAAEIHRNLSMVANNPRNAQAVINAESELIEIDQVSLGERPAPTHTGPVTTPQTLGDPENEAPFDPLGTIGNQAPTDGGKPTAAALKAGWQALSAIAPFTFNLLCLPAAANLTRDGHRDLMKEAQKFCRDKRAFLIVDPPADVDTLDNVMGSGGWLGHVDAMRSPNAAAYFPRVHVADPLNEGRPREVGPSGIVAGIYASTDASRGIWKAPAGTDARVAGATLPLKLTDLQNGALNTLGINALRTFPIHGNVAWGARTLDGADQQASEWKYIPVRRTALYIEESLYQGIQSAVFMGNNETLWAQLRLNVGAFMHDLFRQGAFQGTTPREAYFVKCDAETTTQSDIDRGIVNVLVGFAPLKPAEFVVVRIQQIVGQLES